MSHKNHEAGKGCPGCFDDAVSCLDELKRENEKLRAELSRATETGESNPWAAGYDVGFQRGVAAGRILGPQAPKPEEKQPCANCGLSWAHGSAPCIGYAPEPIKGKSK